MSKHFWGYYYINEPESLYLLGHKQMEYNEAVSHLKETPFHLHGGSRILRRIQLMAVPFQPQKDPKSISVLRSAMPAEYNKGYKTGLFWDASWYPGGPIGTSDVTRVWQAGFSDGLTRRFQECPAFERWFRAQKSGYARYTEPEAS